MTTAPAKALTAGEQKNLKALIENDYARVRHALHESYVAKIDEINTEAEELYPPEMIDAAREAITEAFTRVQEIWKLEIEAIQALYPDVQISNGRPYRDPEEPTVPLPHPSVGVVYPNKEGWIASQQALALKARQEAEAQLKAAELEAHRAVLVGGVGSQEALNVLNSIPPAADLFRARNAELEAAPTEEAS